MKKFVSMAAILLALAAVFFIMNRWDQNRAQALAGRELPTATSLEDFQLSHSDGSPFTRESFKDHWTILYLGFTHCPDACPTAMTYFKGEMKRLDAEPDVVDKVQFYMVSIDPKRDTAERLKSYAASFHPRLRTASGDEGELKKLAKGLMTSFHKEDDLGPDLYMMAHSPRYFLINPSGKLFAFYEPPVAPGALAEDLSRLSRKQTSILGFLM